MKIKIKRNNLILTAFILVFSSCRVENSFYFDINTQTICSCGKVLYKISIDNDSIKPDGCQYEGGILLVWNDTINPPPNKIKIDSIPDKYDIYRGGYNFYKKFRLKPNSTYTLSDNGLGGVEYRVKVWTNSNGKVIKTTQSSGICNSH